MILDIKIQNCNSTRARFASILFAAQDSRKAVSTRALLILHILEESGLIVCDDIMKKIISTKVVLMRDRNIRDESSLHVVNDVGFFLKISMWGNLSLNREIQESFNSEIHRNIRGYEHFVYACDIFRVIQMIKVVMCRKNLMSHENVRLFLDCIIQEYLMIFEKDIHMNDHKTTAIDDIMQFIVESIILVVTKKSKSYIFLIFWESIQKLYNSQYKNWIKKDVVQVDVLSEIAMSRRDLINTMKKSGYLYVSDMIHQKVVVVFSEIFKWKTNGRISGMKMEIQNENLKVLYPNFNIRSLLKKTPKCAALKMSTNTDDYIKYTINHDSITVPAVILDVLNRIPVFFRENSSESSVENTYMNGIHFWCIVLYITNLIQ
jgi:hypothetical protein